MPDNHDDLDQLIDSALANYAEPNIGLEDRILTQLEAHRASTRANTTPTRKRWLRKALIWPIALPLAACAILIVIFLPRTTHQSPTQQAQRSTAPQTQSAQNNAAPQPREHHTQPHLAAARASRRTTHKPAPLPKQDIFPTPRPLSPEEQAMAHFVANTPPSEIQAMQQAQQQQDKPLHIAAITIQPIQPLDETEK